MPLLFALLLLVAFVHMRPTKSVTEGHGRRHLLQRHLQAPIDVMDAEDGSLGSKGYSKASLALGDPWKIMGSGQRPQGSGGSTQTPIDGVERMLSLTACKDFASQRIALLSGGHHPTRGLSAAGGLPRDSLDAFINLNLCGVGTALFHVAAAGLLIMPQAKPPPPLPHLAGSSSGPWDGVEPCVLANKKPFLVCRPCAR